MDSDAMMAGLLALTMVFFALSASRVILRPFKGKARESQTGAGVGSQDRPAISHPDDARQERLTEDSTLPIVPSLLGPDASETYAKHQDSVPASTLADSRFARAEPGASRQQGSVNV